MNTTLTTFDGFPRSDVDVAQSTFPSILLSRQPSILMVTVRTTRARIIPLRNDYKALMTRLEAAVHTQFASQSAAPPPAPSTTSPSNPPTASSRTDETPFARVDTVVPGSPAEAAGLKAGDMVQRFGDANWLNHEKLTRVAQVVGQSEGVSFRLSLVMSGVLTVYSGRSQYGCGGGVRRRPRMWRWRLW